MLDQLRTFATAMTPIGELRLAIPLGLSVYDLPWYQVFPLAVVGNMVPVFFILGFLQSFSRYLLSFPNPLGRLLGWWLGGLERRHRASFVRYGPWALTIFVAIPFPLTGAWTGAALAFLFRIPWGRAIASISLGVVIAGILVSLSTLGIMEIVS